MHVIEPKQTGDGHWVMAVRTMSPKSGPYPVCDCGTHKTAMDARNCRDAKEVAREIALEGETVIEGLKPYEEPIEDLEVGDPGIDDHTLLNYDDDDEW